MRKMFVVVALLACAHAAPAPIELVESEPVETTLDRPELRDAFAVWPEMISRATARIDFAEMYAVDEGMSRLTPVIDTVFQAAARGVRVRFLTTVSFAKTYPSVLAALQERGVAVRKLEKPFLHAKYFVVDGREAFLGSQNFDWRSLQHIQELGVRFRQPEAIRELEDIFETDWTGAPQRPSTAYEFPERTADGADETLVASPKGALPDERLWDLPALAELVDSAHKSVRVQALTYSETPQLSDALVRAAARGVHVQMILSDWELRPKTLAALRALDPRIEVRIFTVPQASSGFVPFGRVVHAKYCVVDGVRGWVGTGNWEPDYFFKDRNVGLLVEGGQIPSQLEAFFLGNWNSAYVAPFDRAREYAPPKISLAR
ncbi:MAG: phosphatidylserine/phosphatidylglycerophosphate/cardiolipin synthase family protein [Myxococcales bacterium]|nr:phospholipase D-like domain-containing protein [Myxococcales bacterium]